MKVAAVVSDLLIFSRIHEAVASAGAAVTRVDAPAALPDEPFDLVLVEWSSRGPDWAASLSGRSDTRVIVFGPHTDLEAHAAARAAGLGPMWARSKFVAELPRLLGGGA